MSLPHCRSLLTSPTCQQAGLESILSQCSHIDDDAAYVGSVFVSLPCPPHRHFDIVTSENLLCQKVFQDSVLTSPTMLSLLVNSGSVSISVPRPRTLAVRGGLPSARRHSSCTVATLPSPASPPKMFCVWQKL